MKKLLVTIVTVFIFSSSLLAQVDVKVNAFGLFFKNYGMGAEYIINDEISAGAFINYDSYRDLGIFLDVLSGGSANTVYSSFTFSPEFRYYINPEDGADNRYFSAYLRYQSANWTDLETGIPDPQGNNIETLYDVDNKGFAIGIGAGKKWVTNSGLYFETYYGVGKFLTNSITYSNSAVENKMKTNGNEDEYEFYAQWDLRFHISIGYRFGGY